MISSFVWQTARCRKFKRRPRSLSRPSLTSPFVDGGQTTPISSADKMENTLAASFSLHGHWFEREGRVKLTQNRTQRSQNEFLSSVLQTACILCVSVSSSHVERVKASPTRQSDSLPARFCPQRRAAISGVFAAFIGNLHFPQKHPAPYHQSRDYQEMCKRRRTSTQASTR